MRTTPPVLTFLLAFAVALAAVAVAACEPRATAGARPQPPDGEVWLTRQQLADAHVEVEPIAARAVDDAVETSGKVTFDDLRVSHVFSPVTGRVTRILAEPGQRVKKGAALATIESPDVGNAFADVAKAEADSAAAQHELARQRDLYDAHAASLRDLETAQDNAAKAKAELERARRKAALFHKAPSDDVTQGYTLRAPIDGEVIARALNPGAEVQGQYSGGTAVELFTIGELDSVWVLADVFEMDLARVRIGAPVTVRVIAYPAKTFTGRVDYIASALDPTSRTTRVRCTIANGARELKPEMYASTTIAVAGKPALAVPRAAALHIADQTIVFVESGLSPEGLVRFVRRVVAVDESEGRDYVPVIRGLSEGEKVVRSGALLLSGML